MPSPKPTPSPAAPTGLFAYKPNARTFSKKLCDAADEETRLFATAAAAAAKGNGAAANAKVLENRLNMYSPEADCLCSPTVPRAPHCRYAVVLTDTHPDHLVPGVLNSLGHNEDFFVASKMWVHYCISCHRC